MGMFDYLYIDTEMLPVSKEEKEAIGKNPGWQTKDWDCILTEIYITNDGELKVNEWKYVTVPKEERPHPNEEGLLGMMGSIRRENERLEKKDYHGYITFYGDINSEWYEFVAKFTDGKLTSLEGGKTDFFKNI